jgi:hypothetical protein
MDSQFAAAKPVETKADERAAPAGVSVPGTQGKTFLSPRQAQVALEQLERWCLDKNFSSEQLDEAASALREAGYKVELSRIVHHALADPQANPHVGALWMRRVVSRRRWNGAYPDHMDALCREGEIGHRAVIEFVETVSTRGKHALVRRALRKHGRWLRQHPQGWTAAARALARLGLYGTLARWMADWRARPELDLELLYFLALALRTTGEEKEAHEVVRQALTKPEAVQNYPALKLWYALEEALAGRTEPALEHFQQLEPASWDEYTTCLYYLTRGVIRVRQASPEARREAFDRDYYRIRERFRVTRVHQCGILVRREYRRCLWRMARESGRTGRGFLAMWQSADTWWFAAPLLVIPGLQLLLPVYLFRLLSPPRRKSA